MSGKSSSIHMDIDKMKRLIDTLKTKPVIQVGIFSGKNARTNSGDLTNATLGAIHELGAPERRIPARSFLRTPLHDHVKEIMASVRGRKLDVLAITKEGKEAVTAMWKEFGIKAEQVVLQAFDTQGYGKWAPLRYKTLLGKLRGPMRKRKIQAFHVMVGNAKAEILMDSGQLRRAIRSRVVFKY